MGMDFVEFTTTVLLLSGALLIAEVVKTAVKQLSQDVYKFLVVKKEEILQERKAEKTENETAI